MGFIKKQFIDILEWTESGDGTLADVSPPPGTYKLTTQTLPVLTYLKNWDKLFESPFKSDVYFFSMRQQLDRRWGTTQPVTIRDKDFGAVRLRAFGNCAYRVSDPKVFHTTISGTRDRYTIDDLEGQLRGLMLQHTSDAVASSGLPFLDLAANLVEFAAQLREATAPDFAKLGLALEAVTMQNVSLPEDLQKVLDQKIGMGMVGQAMGKFMQYQTAQAIPKLAEGAASAAACALPMPTWPPTRSSRRPIRSGWRWRDRSLEGDETLRPGRLAAKLVATAV